MNNIINKEKIKMLVRKVMDRLCKVKRQDDKTEEQAYQDFLDKQKNADRQQRFREKWGKECQTLGPKNKAKRPTDQNKVPIKSKAKTKKKSPYG